VVAQLVNINSKAFSRVAHSEKVFMYYSETNPERDQWDVHVIFTKINDVEPGGSIAKTISKEFSTASKKCHTT